MWKHGDGLVSFMVCTVDGVKIIGHAIATQPSTQLLILFPEQG